MPDCLIKHNKHNVGAVMCGRLRKGDEDIIRLLRRHQPLEDLKNDSFRFKASSAIAARTKKEKSHVLTED
jgi:hypothetical protein